MNVHLAQISIPELQVVLSGRFAGVHLFAGGQPHGALIGRTLLRHVTMVYNGVTGPVSIVRSLPSAKSGSSITLVVRPQDADLGSRNIPHA